MRRKDGEGGAGRKVMGGGGENEENEGGACSGLGSVFCFFGFPDPDPKNGSKCSIISNKTGQIRHGDIKTG